MMLRHIAKSSLLNAAYGIALLFILPRLVYQTIFHGKYRGTLGIRLLGLTARRPEPVPCVWFKASSLGEVRSLEPMVRRFQSEYPQWHCIVSATTTSGYLLAKRLLPDLYVFPHPVDFSWSVRTAMTRLRPDLLVHVDLGVCPNLVQAAQARGVGLAIINGRMNDRDYQRFRRGHWWMSAALGQFDLIAAQTNEYADRFVRLGAPVRETRIVGSLKYDCVSMDRDHVLTSKLASVAGIRRGDPVMMAGSTYPGEEEVVLTAYLRLREKFPQMRLIIAPRHVERVASIVNLLNRKPITWQRRSQLAIQGNDTHAQVLLVDTIGEAAAWWGVCQIAFVGGSLFSGLRGKNMIEPAAYGAAVCFGPDTKDFRHVTELMIQRGAATVVSGPGDLFRFVDRCLTDTGFARRMGNNARQLVLSRRGAMDLTMQLLEPLATQLQDRTTSQPRPPHTPWRPIRTHSESESAVENQPLAHL